MKPYYSLRDSYRPYKTQVENPVDIKIFVSVLNGYMKFLTRKLFERGELMLPQKLGNVLIQGKKVNVRIEDGEIKGLAPDWVKTKQLWEEDAIAKENKKLVYHFNEDTNGIRYKFRWSTTRYLIPNKTLYGLKMTRTNKRFLSQLVKKGKEYLIVSKKYL